MSHGHRGPFHPDQGSHLSHCNVVCCGDLGVSPCSSPELGTAILPINMGNSLRVEDGSPGVSWQMPLSNNPNHNHLSNCNVVCCDDLGLSPCSPPEPGTAILPRNMGNSLRVEDSTPSVSWQMPRSNNPNHNHLSYCNMVYRGDLGLSPYLPPEPGTAMSPINMGNSLRVRDDTPSASL